MQAARFDTAVSHDSYEAKSSGAGSGAPQSRSAQWTRRSALALLASVTAAGCGRSGADSDDTAEAAPSIRRDVPLKVAWVGEPSDAEAIRVAWSMAVPQALEIEVISPIREGDSAMMEQIAERASQVDVAVFPQMAVGAMERTGAVVSFNEDTLQEYHDRYGKPLPAVQNGLGSYGGHTWGVAIGARLFGVLSIDQEFRPKTWSEYHDWVQTLEGRAAEPLADGWAATSFLNRCASSIERGWLFKRTTLQPVIDSEDYVASLTQMIETAGHYEGERKTPREIWHDLRRGRLRGGIGYEVATTAESGSEEAVGEEFAITVADCPVETQSDQLWFDPQTPLAAVSIGCRQTDASKQFIGWLIGGEGIASVREQVNGLSLTRESADDDLATSSSYTRWLSQRLQTRQVALGLLLPGAAEYYQALDRQIIRCLNGELKPGQALQAAATEWQTITDRLGRSDQIAAWRKTMGLGA
ncbi:hypothetical protein FYK55_00715 [Roseiconus nitratireducens]|uniref:Extracellular solute-binding protein n=1 Tax=Roseiconus nitratireducens TaxID=2605748 RepID=A0A5M6DKQ9_9BACT|nr:hypothetical protein [Roseiconus nitratireducens]KAA5546976.1 hypothetical protein FYK55_00715 [Roseiconus nitratireducens]